MRKELTVRTIVAGVLLSVATVAGAAEVPEIARKDGCMACHRVDVKYLGPSFQDIADRYRDDPAAFDNMVDKVTNGGFGGWGRMPMPASDPKFVSPADVKALVNYILKLPPVAAKAK